jgi:hypothetical protein
MKAKFAGKCSACGGVIAKGEECDYERGKGIRHFNCPDKTVDNPEDLAEQLGFK